MLTSVFAALAERASRACGLIAGQWRGDSLVAISSVCVSGASFTSEPESLCDSQGFLAALASVQPLC
ncbi:unnamed protein product [Ixodes pacificus]